MRCLHCHSSVPLLHSQLKHKQKLKAKEQLRLFNTEASRQVLQRQKHVSNSILSLRTSAISNSNSTLFIAAKIPPSQSGDITVFLQTSALLLVVYLLGNFVAPYFISKYFEFDKVEEDQKNSEK